jgi:hypothetical protein
VAAGPAQVDVTLTMLFAGWRHIDRIAEARATRRADEPTGLTLAEQPRPES